MNQWLEEYGLDRYVAKTKESNYKEDVEGLDPALKYPFPVEKWMLTHLTKEAKYDLYVPYIQYYDKLISKVKADNPKMSKDDIARLELAIDLRLRLIRAWCGLEVEKVELPPHEVYRDETHIWVHDNRQEVDVGKYKEWWKQYKGDHPNVDLTLDSCHKHYPRVYKALSSISNEAKGHIIKKTPFHNLEGQSIESLKKRVDAIIEHLKTKQCKSKAKEVDVPKLSVKLQVLEADRRQLLMLLCGNVPATLLVDKRTGYIRRPKQICHHIQFLLRRHRMTNSSVGLYTKIVTSTLRAGRIGAGYMVMLVAWSGLLLATMGMLTGAVYMFHGTRLNQFVRRRVIYGLFKVVLFAWRVLMRLLDKLLGTGRPEWTYNVHELRGNPTRDTDALLQWMTSVGFAGVIYKVLNSWKVDVDKTRRVTALHFLFQKVADQWSLLQVSHYIAQSQTGLFGEDSASGLTDDQMGLMYKVQKALKELDEEIDLDSDRTVDQSNIHELLDEYGNTYRSGSRQRLCIELHNAYQRSTSHALNPRHFRARMLKDYEHEFRAHHFFNSYGEPRSVLHIVLAYLLCWRREKMNTVLPTIPYKGRELVDDYMNPMNFGQLQETREHVLKGEWWQLNPIQCSEWARLHASDPLVREERTVDNTDKYTEGPATAQDYEEERHTKETKAYRQHLNLDYLFKNEKGYDGWIQSKLGRSEVAMNKFRNISGWTHRVSDALLARVNQQFEVMNANDATDYKRWQERQVMGRDRASVNVDKNYHRVMHGEALAKSGLFSQQDAGQSTFKGDTNNGFKALRDMLNVQFSIQDVNTSRLFANADIEHRYQAYKDLGKALNDPPPAEEAQNRLLYWCGFYAICSDQSNVPENSFQNTDESEAVQKIRKGYKKVLLNRLGKEGVEYLEEYYDKCKFNEETKRLLDEHKEAKRLGTTNTMIDAKKSACEYLVKCKLNQRTNM